MKLVTALIEPRAVSRVRYALELFGVTQLSLLAAQSPHEARVETYRGAKFHVDTAAATRLDVLCDLFDAEDVVAVIVAAARRDGGGEGAVWISEVDRFVPITSGVPGSVARR